MEEQKLSINNLCVSFQSDRGSVTAVEDVTFGIRKGEILGMIGESGCGKSTIGLSIMNLLPEKTSNIDKGEIIFDGKDLSKLKESELEIYVEMTFQ